MMKLSGKKFVLCVSNDLTTDQRLNKSAHTLSKKGADVLLVGRVIKNKKASDPQFRFKRFKLWFSKGALFYANYNIRLFFFLLFKKLDIIISNDLDTLPACFLAAKIKDKEIVYDSHEYFTEVPELVGRPGVKKVWGRIESFLFPRLKHVYTVCDSIAEIYNAKYGVPVSVVRNIPLQTSNYSPSKEIKLPFDNDYIIYQGAVNIGRGLEEIILAMDFVEDLNLLIIGDGDILEELQNLVKSSGLDNKVYFTGRLPFQEIFPYTKKAKFGVSIEQNIGLNYYYALPNKLFDYIHAGIPVLGSRLPEISRIINKYQVGTLVESYRPIELGRQIEGIARADHQLKLWADNCRKASLDLSWEIEEEKLYQIIDQAIK